MYKCIVCNMTFGFILVDVTCICHLSWITKRSSICYSWFHSVKQSRTRKDMYCYGFIYSSPLFFSSYIGVAASDRNFLVIEGFRKQFPMTISHLSRHGCNPTLKMPRISLACRLCLVSLVYQQTTLGTIHRSGTHLSVQFTRPSWIPVKKEAVGVEAFCGNCFLKGQITWTTGMQLFFQSLLLLQTLYLCSPKGLWASTRFVLGNATGVARKGILLRLSSTMMIWIMWVMYRRMLTLPHTMYVHMKFCKHPYCTMEDLKLLLLK